MMTFPLNTSAPDKMTKAGKNSAGFTLIEVIVVVVVIGILATVGFPLFSKWIPAYKVKGAAQILYADFQKAKLHSIKTNRDVTFNFTAIANCSGQTGYTFTDTDGEVVSSATFDNGICIYESDFVNDSSGFDPRGLQAEAIPALHTVKLKHVKHSKEYVVTQSIAGILQIN